MQRQVLSASQSPPAGECRNAHGPGGEQRLAPVGTAARRGVWRKGLGNTEETRGDEEARGGREYLETPLRGSRSDKNLILAVFYD